MLIECCTVTLKNIRARDEFTFYFRSLVVHLITSKDDSFLLSDCQD